MGKRRMRPRRIGYLGPEGTFTHEALDHLTERRGAEAAAFSSVADVFHALEEGGVDGGLVPIENSIEGAVTATLDGLAFGRSTIRILAEVVLPIHFDVFVPPGAKRAKLKEVMSHPHALAQCRRFIERRGLATQVALSTADACRRLRESPRAGTGAIASRKAGEIYGLVPAARGIEDAPDAVTRFVYLEPARIRRAASGPTGRDKTSLVLTPKHDRPGSLVELLQEFSSRRINLSRIESRPLKTQLGRYCFFIDASGHMEDELLGAAVRAFSQKDVEVKFLGSYPDASIYMERRRPLISKEKAGPARRVGICGLGIIGGSMAKALNRIDGISVRGYDTDRRTMEEATAAGIVCVRSIVELAKDSDFIVAATPIGNMVDLFRSLAPALRRGQTVTDVGSVKGPVLEAARKILPRHASFIGGHPMAGSERSGFSHSRSDLFRGSTWVLTIDDQTRGESCFRLMDLLFKLEVRIVPMRPDDHDEAVSLISHVPHVLAYSLMAAADRAPARAFRRDLAAGSFKDLVRVSGSPPDLWSEICRMNRSRIQTSLDGTLSRLSEMEALLRRGDFDRLRSEFARGHRGYRRLLEADRAGRTTWTVSLPRAKAASQLPHLLGKIASRQGRIEGMTSAGGRVKLFVSTCKPIPEVVEEAGR